MSRELIERLQAATEEIFRETPVRRASGNHLPTDAGNDYYCQHEWSERGAWHSCVEHSAHSMYHQCRCGEQQDGQGRTYGR